MKKILSFILMLSLILSLVPFAASAADAQVNVIGDERIAFVSGFGRMSYEGKNYVSFKTVEEAVNALGKDGGKIILTGTHKLPEFKDIPGRQPIRFEGIGAVPRSNVLDFSGMSEVVFEGDVIFANLFIRLSEGAYVITNGHMLDTASGFDTYNTSQSSVVTYVDPPSVAPGTVEGNADVINLSAGRYTTLAAGSVGGKTVNGNTLIHVGGATIDRVVGGNIGNGTMNGDAKVVIDSGSIGELIAGSEGGTVNGNVWVELGGGTIEKAVIGAKSGSVINGSVVAVFKGVSSGTPIVFGDGKVSGKKIAILTVDSDVTLPNGFDYIINLDGKVCDPVFDGNKLTGFKITDEFGVPSEAILLNGSEVKGENGIFNIPEGTSTVKVESKINVKVNKNANYVAGRGEGIFDPQANMTRAEAITLLTRLVVDENLLEEVKADYHDVESGAWYEKYVGFLQTLGYLDTISEGFGSYIRPTKNITRAEFCALIYQISKLGEPFSSLKLTSFSDVNSTNKYIKEITYAVEAGIVTGYDDGSFKPNNNITRAEVVTMVNRFLGRIPNGNEGKNSFNDISTHWAKSQILAACNAEGETWTSRGEEKKYQISGTSSEDYIKALYDQSSGLSANAIREAVDVISDQMKKDILGTGNTINYYPERLTGTTYYISEKNGDDNNDGLSPETAWKTPANIKTIIFAKAGTSVLFERGGIYRGTVAMANNMTYGAYGEGEKPLIMQSKKNYADPSLWVKTEWENVWECTELLANVGIIGFDHDLYDYSEASYDEQYGLIMNKGSFGFTGPQDLNGDLQFYSDVSKGMTTPDKLYVYSKSGNPGERFESIEIGERFNTFNGTIKNVVIDNLAMKFTGAHAVGFGTCENVTVTNCVFSWLGGSVLTYRTADGPATNYGNAVQVYGGCDGYYVKNNWMYQIYDTAVTHQRSASTGNCIQRDVDYLNNLMEYVYWGIEFYNAPPTAEQLGGKKDMYKRITEDVRSAFNVLRFGGYGWGSITRYRGAQLYCGSTLSDNQNCIAEYNIFDRSAGNLLSLPANSTETEDKNFYIQTLGQSLGRLKGTTFSCDFDSAARIEKNWGDKNAVVIVIDPEIEPVVKNIPEGLPPKP